MLEGRAGLAAEFCQAQLLQVEAHRPHWLETWPPSSQKGQHSVQEETKKVFTYQREQTPYHSKASKNILKMEEGESTSRFYITKHAYKTVLFSKGEGVKAQLVQMIKSDPL